MICFDLGGVILDIHHTWDDAARATGLIPTRQLGRLANFGPGDALQEGRTTDSVYLAELAEWLRIDSTSQARDVHLAILKEPFPAAEPLVAALREVGYPVGLLSNTNELHWEHCLDRWPVCKRFKPAVVSHLVGVAKPDVRIFRAFEDAAGCLASEVLYFDDNEANILAARGAGWDAVLVPAISDPPGFCAREIVARRPELMATLAGVASGDDEHGP